MEAAPGPMCLSIASLSALSGNSHLIVQLPPSKAEGAQLDLIPISAKLLMPETALTGTDVTLFKRWRAFLESFKFAADVFNSFLIKGMA